MERIKVYKGIKIGKIVKIKKEPWLFRVLSIYKAKDGDIMFALENTSRLSRKDMKKLGYFIVATIVSYSEIK